MSDYQNPYETNKSQIPTPPGYENAAPIPTSGYAAPPVTAPKTSGLAIAGFVLVFFVPLIGVILCGIAWNQGKDGSAKTGLAKAGVWVGIAFMLLNLLQKLLLVLQQIQQAMTLFSPMISHRMFTFHLREPGGTNCKEVVRW